MYTCVAQFDIIYYFFRSLSTSNVSGMHLENGCVVSWLHNNLFISASFDTFDLSKRALSYTLMSETMNALEISTYLPSLEIKPKTILVSENRESHSLPLDQRRSLMYDAIMHSLLRYNSKMKENKFIIRPNHKRTTSF